MGIITNMIKLPSAATWRNFTLAGRTDFALGGWAGGAAGAGATAGVTGRNGVAGGAGSTTWGAVFTTWGGLA
ncbi:hypothetical protein [uncultured Litoreibacter sp.]|uniref:hypothetical protein n=1 Tax=uncultured Litoreibacter sp. TaxID=1392394 RepID=UPI00262812B7|nr:hypothetical protein [uncultured Litoreibacter sp.]